MLVPQTPAKADSKKRENLVFGSGQTTVDAMLACRLNLEPATKGVMITTKSMRHFAAGCLQWAADAKDPSQRQMIVDAARCWTKTAEEIDRRVQEGRGEPLPDLKNKLN